MASLNLRPPDDGGHKTRERAGQTNRAVTFHPAGTSNGFENLGHGMQSDPLAEVVIERRHRRRLRGRLGIGLGQVHVFQTMTGSVRRVGLLPLRPWVAALAEFARRC
jgi:hypothetical protein